MKKLLLMFCLLLLPISLSPFIVNAGDEYPPKTSSTSEAGAYVEPYTIEEGPFDDILKVKKREFVDNFGIHYCLAIAKGKITGTANGAQSCGYTGAFDVSGSYKGKNYTFTVTNPTTCDLQYYIVKGVADKKFKRAKTGTGTYDWNGDGVDGSLNFTYEGPCGN
ncbi:MAG: hypothetical protein HW390_464 [Candidatus Brocadiaceae bacterium]|nr:hypothetical protein [Candidatus Brocadiaceae bacterium]